MPQTIPLQPVPRQTLSITLGGQNVGITIYTQNTPGAILSAATGATADSTLITSDDTDITADADAPSSLLSLSPQQALYIDVTLDGEAIITGKLVRILSPLLLTSAYAGFEGELEFFDTLSLGLQESTEPAYTGLGSRYQLVYFSPAELAA